MRLAARVAWRLVEWPLSIATTVTPFLLSFLIGHGHFRTPYGFGDGSDAQGAVAILVGVVGAIGGLALFGYQLHEEKPWITIVAGFARRVVTEERKRMEMERGQDSRDTYLRAAGRDG